MANKFNPTDQLEAYASEVMAIVTKASYQDRTVDYLKIAAINCNTETLENIAESLQRIADVLEGIR